MTGVGAPRGHARGSAWRNFPSFFSKVTVGRIRHDAEHRDAGLPPERALPPVGWDGVAVPPAGPDTSRRVARPPRRSPFAALAGSCGEAWPTWPRSRTGPHNSMGRISSASGCAAAAGAAISTSQIRQRRSVRAQLSRAYLIVSHRPSFRGGRGAGTLIGEAHLPREGLRHWRLPAGTGGRRPFGGDNLELVFQRSAHSSRATPSNPLSPSASLGWPPFSMTVEHGHGHLGESPSPALGVVSGY